MAENRFPWKTASILWLSGTLTTPLLVPYLLGLFAEAPNAPALPKGAGWVLAQRLTIRNGLMLLIPAFVGMWLAQRLGWSAPFLAHAFDGAPKPARRLARMIREGVVAGILAALALFAIDAFFFYGLHVTAPAPEIHARIGVPVWRAALASVWAPFAEEVFCRLFVQSLLAVSLSLLFRVRAEGKARDAVFWLAAAGSAIAFAWLHVSNQELYAESLQELVRIRTFLISGTAGVVFARIFWKKGLEAAIVAHGAADIVVHVVRPLVDSGWERIVS